MVAAVVVVVVVIELWSDGVVVILATKIDSLASSSGPNMWCFYHVYFDMCFGPQWRALFRHLNFQERLEYVTLL